MKGSMSRVMLLTALGFLMLMFLVDAARGREDSGDDIDHGIDFDFDEDDQDFIPVTPISPKDEDIDKKDDDTDSDKNKKNDQDSKEIVPIDDDSSQNGDWHQYLDYLNQYKDQILSWGYHLIIYLDRIFLTEKHKSAEGYLDAVKYGLYDGLFKL